MTDDWREPLLHGASELAVHLQRRNPADWPGYEPKASVRAYDLRDGGPVAAVWDFSVQGGSFGEDDAAVLQAACARAVERQVPLLTLVRTGGTRLQEGMAALVGIPRSVLALQSLAEAGLPHVSVADAPTTGGVWIGVVSSADVRVAVAGGTVGFAGPRVVEVLTGELPGPDSHTAESAYAAGLVDAVLPREEVAGWVRGVLTTLAPPSVGAFAGEPAPDTPTDPPQVGGWEQVLRSRARTASGADLLAELLTDRVPLQARYADATVVACLGRLAGRPVVGVALAAELGGKPTPDGYRLAARAYRLAARLRLPVVSLVDTPGADPGPAAERDGIAPAMGEAMDALLRCPTPTLALVHGEGGSGGALAAAVTDVVLVGPEAYFAPMGPEGATAALRRPKEECADRMRITPHDLVQLGFADRVAGAESVAAELVTLVDRAEEDRLRARLARWSSPLPGSLQEL